ncbi:odorant receptor 13a-like [Lasioglossum baleicum]|uniref:odorant receptor 13a-like n=1 Tax=Lasioglossum baleicum TaxID=434251 RepID=UPI003FCC9443
MYICSLCLRCYFSRIFKNILIAMATDWTDTSITNDNIVTMVEKANLSNRCSQLVLSMYAIAVFLYSIVYINVFRNAGRNSVLTESADLLIKMQLPSAVYQRLNYQYAMIAQFIQLFFVGITIAIVNTLMITLVLHVGGQVEVMHQALAVLHTNGKGRILLKRAITYLLEKHQKSITFIKHINSLFSFIALMQILCNTINICCIGFLMVISFDSDQNVRMVIKILFFYLCIASEAFIFCFSGEYLSTKSTSINVAAYNSLWYLLEPADSRVMVLLMLRSQKQSTITAGKIVDLSLQRFTGIMKASASYISILYAMY